MTEQLTLCLSGFREAIMTGKLCRVRALTCVLKAGFSNCVEKQQYKVEGGSREMSWVAVTGCRRRWW